MAGTAIALTVAQLVAAYLPKLMADAEKAEPESGKGSSRKLRVLGVMKSILGSFLGNGPGKINEPMPDDAALANAVELLLPVVKSLPDWPTQGNAAGFAPGTYLITVTDATKLGWKLGG